MNNKPNRAKRIAELKSGSESRSKRVQILITPQMYSDLKSLSEESGASVNEIINRSIESYIKDI